MLKLVDVTPSDDELLKVRIMMYEEPGIREVFNGRGDRLATSHKVYIIMNDNQEVGFANLVVEKQNYNFYFLDMGIKENYRGNGIATEVLQTLKNINCKPIIIETRENNTLANCSAERIGCMLMSKDNKNYYLLQKERYNEFIDNGYLDKLTEHLNEDKDKRFLYK